MNISTKRKTNQSGFTLTEILIVITILVILGVSALININPLAQFLKGYDTVRKADLAKIKTAFEAYYTDHDCYPSKDKLQNCGSDDLSPYLDRVPCDPNSGEPYDVFFGDEESQTCPQKFVVYASLSNKFDPKGDLITLCPDKIAAVSTNNAYLDTVKGCSGRKISSSLYGCRQGSCALLFQDSVPTCGATYDSTDCGGRNCSKKNFRGLYAYECK